MIERVQDLIYGRPQGLPLPTKMREIYKVIIYCQQKKKVSFCRRQIETKYTNPHIYTSGIYPRNHGPNKQIEPEHGASKDDMTRLRRALKTMDFAPSIDLENNLEIWRTRDE